MPKDWARIRSNKTQTLLCFDWIYCTTRGQYLCWWNLVSLSRLKDKEQSEWLIYFFSNVIKTIYLIKTKLGLQITLQVATKDGFESKRESVINFIQNVCPSKSLLSDVVTSALLYNFCCSLKTHFLSKNHSVEWKILQQIFILHLNTSFHQKTYSIKFIYL